MKLIKKFYINNKIHAAFRATSRFDYEINCRKYLDSVKEYL